MNPIECAGEFGLVDVRVDLRDAGRVTLFEQVGHAIGRQMFTTFEQQHLPERRIKLVRANVEQVGAQFVGQQRHGEPALCERLLQRVEHGRPLCHVVAAQHVDVTGIQA